VVSWQFLLDIEREPREVCAKLCAVTVRDESFPIVFRDDIDPVIFLVQHMDHLSPFNFEFIVDAWCEVMENDHL